jgi:hypothetical protein
VVVREEGIYILVLRININDNYYLSLSVCVTIKLQKLSYNNTGNICMYYVTER